MSSCAFFRPFTLSGWRSRTKQRRSTWDHLRQHARGPECLEQRIAPATVTASAPGSFVDSDEDKFLVKLTGPGQVEVLLDDPDGDGHGAIASLVLSGTTSKSKLSVAVKKGGDGEVAIGAISGSGDLASFLAPKSDLIGAGINVVGTFGSLTLGDIRNGADITLAGTAANKIRIAVGEIADGTNLSLGTTVAKLTAIRVGTGEWRAPSFGAISTKAGGFGGSVLSTASAAELDDVPALRSLKIVGGDLFGAFSGAGSVGSISVKHSKAGGGNISGATLAAANFKAITASADVESSVLLAGANLGDDFALGGNDTFAPGNIGKFSVGGNVTASVLGAGLVTSDSLLRNDDDGLLGNSLIKSFAVKKNVDRESLFAAALFTKNVKIGGKKIAPATDTRFLTLGSADTRAPVLNAALVGDTGASALDTITSNANVSGRVTDTSGAPKLKAAFGTSALVDVSSAIGVDGRFTLDAAQLTTLNGGSLPDGPYLLRLQASDAADNAGTILQIAFQLDRTAPATPLFNLSTGSDSGVIGDQLTDAAVVQLTGQGDPNVTVLLGNRATLSTSTGTFVFPDVALASGDNLLTARVIDVAGNVAQSARTITRSGTPGADVVLEWNATNLEAIRLDATAPPTATRGLAMVSGAMFDVVNAFEGTAGFFTTRSAPTGASLQAAVGTAAHDVLVYLYPGQKALFDATLASTLGRVTDGPGETGGVSFGAEMAATVIALRAQDGFNAYVDYSPGSAVGDWQPTGPAFDVALLPQWAQLEPFLMSSGDQFRPAPPPALDSAEYAAAFNEVKTLGVATGSARTPEQTQIARFWGDGSGTYTPAGHWNQIAMELAQAKGLSLSANSRMLAELNLAMADAAIVAWDAKYSHETWRPVTAIQAAADDGNSQTAPDPSWRPLLITPPFPEYVSGHSTFSGAASTVLSAVFGAQTSFSTTGLGLPGVTRSFTSFDAAANEAGQSRIFGGIHFQFANQAGLAAGRALADFVLDRFAVEDDLAAPKILLEGPAEGLVTKQNFTINGRVLDNISGVASFKAQLDGGTPFEITRDANGSFNLPVALALDGTADGSHTFIFSALDAASNATAPKSFGFTLDTRAPALTFTSALDGAALTFGSRIAGTADGTGSFIRSLNYAFDGGTPFSVAIDPATGAFESFLDLSALAAGAHNLAINATDSAGLSVTSTFNVNLAERIPFTILGTTPGDAAADVGTTFRPQVFFSRPVNPTTLNANNFFATGSDGAKLPATIVPSAGGEFAWLFFDEPMPAGANITMHVEGATILAAADGMPLDADVNATPGGLLEISFTTVSLTPLLGTSLSGRVFDPGADLKPMTFDDIRAGADGVLHSADDVFLNPLAGVKVFIVGLEDQAVSTDATGAFSFASVPAGDVKLAIDGRTATNAAAGFFFPEMVMDLNLRAGEANTAMDSMGTLEQQDANADRGEVYLPRLRSSILQNVSNSRVTMVGVDAVSAPNLTEAQRAVLQLEVQAGSLVDANGQPIAAGQVGISTVPPQLVRDMLPPGVLQHTFDITIQAPGAAVFNTPLEITFPNVFNAAPGTKLDFLSFDHTTGRLVIEGTATVSADGLSATTDPDSGITKPGWHGLTPPGSCSGSGGPPPLPPPKPEPTDTIVEHEPQSLGMIFGEAGPGIKRTWSAPGKVPGAPEPPPPRTRCGVPPRPPSGMMLQPSLNVTIEVDGPLATFLTKPADLVGGVDLVSQSFTLQAGQPGEVVFAGVPTTYDELFGMDGFRNLTRDQLYGSKVKITETLQKADGSRQFDIYTFYLYRWVDVIDATLAKDKTGNTAAFHRTLTNSIERTKNVDVHLPGSIQTSFTGGSPFEFGAPLSGNKTAVWMFAPLVSGERMSNVSVEADGVEVGQLVAKGTATTRTVIDINEAGFKTEMDRVIRALTAAPGADMMLGTADDEITYTRTDGRTQIASDRFKTEFAGFLPTDRQPGPDMIPGNADDTFAGGDLAMRIDTEFGRLRDAVTADYSAVNGTTNGYTIGSVSPDVTMTWKDDFRTGVAGRAEFDLNELPLRALITNNVISEAAREWALAEALNQRAMNTGSFAVSNAIKWESGITLGNKLANTVGHEIAHTFGLNDAYLSDPGGAIDANPIPDLMNASGVDDPDKTFSANNIRLLQAALGFQPNGDLPLTAALKMYRDNINLPRNSVGILDETNPDVRRPELAVFSGDTLVIPGEQVPVGEKVAADGAGGTLVTRDLVLTNPGLAPVTISSAAIGAGSAFSLVNNVGGTVLDPGEKVTLTLRFDPQNAGSFADTLTIASDAATSPLFSIQLQADAIPLASTATLTHEFNNFGGVAVASGTSDLPQLATITNSGFQPLSISRVSLAAGTGAFSFLGLPPDLATNPISLGSGESFTFGLAFDPPQPGLQRALVEVGTNDPATPVLNAGAVGTGVGSVVYPDWGDDFVAIRSNSTLRAVSDAGGNFEIFLPAQTDYETIIFDPVTGLVTHNFGTTPTSGRGLDLTMGLVFAASTAPDTDFDGLPDDIEFAVGTGIGKNDTDGDGVSDFAEVLRGLDPLGGRSLPTGVVSAVAMAGEAKEVVAAVLANDPIRQLAFVATGSAGLAIADVTDVSKPTLLGQLDLPGDATDVAVDPLLGIAVVTTNAGGLHFVDVGDPTKLNVLRSVSGSASQVEVGGGRAFVTSGSNLRAYDLLSGDLLQSISTGSNTLTGLSVDGTALFTMESGNTLRAFDVSGGTIAARDTLAMPVGGGKVFVGNGVAHVGGSAFGPGGFASANVADLNALTLLSVPDNTALGGTAFASSGGRFGVAVGHSDFVQGAFRALDVVDISDPANTGNFITRINLPERPLGVVLGSGFAFVADGAAGLQLINFASADAEGVAPVANLVITSLDIDPATPGVQVQEETAIRLHPAITEDVQLAKVDLLLNGIVVASDISFPCDLSTLAPAIGSLVGGPNANLQVRATDTGGNTTVSAPAQITLAPDTFPPSLLSQDPADGATRTQGFRTVTLTFSEPIAPSTVTGQAVHLVGPGGEIAPLSIELRAGNQQARVTFPALAVGNYTFSVDRNEITDTAGNLLGSTTTISGFEIIQATIEWVGATSAFWDQAANWSTGALPVATDVVFVPQGRTLTHRFGTDTIAGLIDGGTLQLNGGTLALSDTGTVGGSFVLDGGTLSGAGELTILGDFAWRAGTMSGLGSTIVAPAADLVLETGQSKRLDTRTLTNQGAIVWTGIGGLVMQNGAILNNGGSIDVQGDLSLLFNGGAAATINNSGTFTKSAGSAALGIGVGFNNTGTVNGNSGQIRFTAGGSGTGNFVAGTGAAIEFAGGTYTLNAGANLSGAGFVRLSSGTLTIANNVSAERFEIASGTLNGTGTLTVNSLLSWNAGTMGGSGTTTVSAGANLVITGPGTKILDARTLSLQGTTNWSGAGGFGMQTGAILNNSGNFDVQGDLSLFLNGGAAPAINNSGTFTKSAGSAALVIGVAFNNTGTVNGNSGQIRFNSGGTATGDFVAASGAAIEFNGATYTLNAGADLSGAGFVRLSSGTLTIANAISAERFEITSGTLNGTGTLTVSNLLNWNGGTIGGSGATTIPAGANAVITGSGTKFLDACTLNLQGTATWTGTGGLGMQNGAILNNGGSIDVQGDLNLLASGGAASSINNSGTFTKSTGPAALLIGVAFNNTGTVNGNSGQFRFNGGGSGSGGFVAGTGAAIEFNGGIYTLNTGANLSGAGFIRLTGGTLTIANSVSAERFEVTNGTLNGTGTLTVSNLLNWSGGTIGGSGATTIPTGANVVISGSGNKFLDARTLNLQSTATWNGGGLGMQNGAIINNSGSFDMQGDLNLFLNGGAAPTINNSGTFTKSSGTGTGTISVAFNNTGTFQIVSGTLNVPGGFTNQNLLAIGKAGRLNVQGAFTQSAVATIRLDIAGTAAGTFGRVTATGAATINGTLDLRLVDGFVPNVSDVFTVFTYASRTGAFVTITDNDAAHLFNPTYNATNLTLTVA